MGFADKIPFLKIRITSGFPVRRLEQNPGYKDPNPLIMISA